MNNKIKIILSNGSVLFQERVCLTSCENSIYDQFTNNFWGYSIKNNLINETSNNKRSKFKKENKKARQKHFIV